MHREGATLFLAIHRSGHSHYLPEDRAGSVCLNRNLAVVVVGTDLPGLLGNLGLLEVARNGRGRLSADRPVAAHLRRSP